MSAYSLFFCAVTIVGVAVCANVGNELITSAIAISIVLVMVRTLALIYGESIKLHGLCVNIGALMG